MATTIKPEIVAILNRSTFENGLLTLPQLERPDYLAVAAVLKKIGGKWNRKLGGTVFDRDPRSGLAQATKEGTVTDLKKDLQQFWTPPELAERMCQMAEVTEQHHVLEPSAGCGRLVEAALQMGGIVHAIEVDTRLCAELEANLEDHADRMAIYCANFLQWTNSHCNKSFTSIVMNPPFARGQDAEHIRTAYRHLAPGGVLVALCSPHSFFAGDAKALSFLNWFHEAKGEVETIDAGAFKASGTMVESRLLTIRRPATTAALGWTPPPPPPSRAAKVRAGAIADLFA